MKTWFLLFLVFLFSPFSLATPWTIAIDPGHGGKDPGAVGRKLGIYEKNVTLSIARELKSLLDKDPNFNAVLTRNGDYYITVSSRSEIARKYKANYLISIHADSSTSTSLRGASVWVLSNRRANSEMGRWLEDDEKRSELLGGAGQVLANHNDKYLDQTVLDLQFGHSQRMGYELGTHILTSFGKITQLSRTTPQHASLGVLRSPDIPSVLVETGYLSNAEEEKKLNTQAYRRRVANMIYEGLLAFRKAYVKADSSPNNLQDSGIRHTVKKGETLSHLANKYGVKISDIQTFNKLTRNTLWIGESLKIPSYSKAENHAIVTAKEEPVILQDSGVRHTVKKGETLTSLANKYGLKVSDIQTFNKLKRDSLWVGETLKIPTKGKVVEKAGNIEQKNTPSLVSVQDSGIRHKVKKGETLTSLANKYGVKVSDIQSLNKLKRNTLWIGETLAIPDNGKQKLDNQNVQSEIPQVHIVKPNQTLYSIARDYHTTVEKLQQLNPNLKEGKIMVGQKIKLR